MIKWLFSILILFANADASAQDIALLSFRAKPPMPYPTSPVAALAAELTSHLQTEHEKVAAIFGWITQNIDYRVSSGLRFSRGYKRSGPDDTDTATTLKPLNLRVAEGVLERREAVCDGYARLFKMLCDYAGVEAVVITGFARGAGAGSRAFRPNHTWNAVRIDGVWRLLDATWASGFTNFRGDVFIRHYDDRYFLTPPAQFIRDHFPEDPAWTLLKDPPVLPEFSRMPFKLTAFVRHKINHFSPSKGIIEAAVGDTVLIEIESADANKKLEVWDTPFGDQRLHTGPVWLNYPERPAIIKGAKITFAYTVSSPHVQWLYVVYNGESILQYRLQVRTGAQASTNLSEKSGSP